MDLEGGQGVVVVHDDMNQQVDADWHPLDRGVLVELYPAQEQRGSVVILMQKDDFFLLQDEDDGVEKLVPLDEVVEVVAGTRKKTVSIRSTFLARTYSTYSVCRRPSS